jgi:Protein of unknown function (DUF4058)
MDPYLEDEALWPWFQHQLRFTLQQAMAPNVRDRYAVLMAERRFHDGPREQIEEYLCIRAAADGRLVTLLDLVSPADKQTDAGRQAYLATRQEARGAGASVVEIDLVLHGRPMLDYSRDGLPDWDYAVTVTRATLPERFEIYTGTLLKRLPRFKVPLAADDRDTVLDLQAAVWEAYDACDFASRIDYRRDPAVPLTDEMRSRFAEVLGNRPIS